MERTTFTAAEVADYIGLSKDFVYKLVRENKIPYIRIGARVVFKRTSIEQWLTEKEG